MGVPTILGAQHKRDADDAKKGRMKSIRKIDFFLILFIPGLIRVIRVLLWF
jgi:hypothetical protein